MSLRRPPSRRLARRRKSPSSELNGEGGIPPVHRQRDKAIVMSPVHPSLLSLVGVSSISLWRREVVRFYRQRSRVLGVIASPLVFWLVIGSGFGTSFRPESGHRVSYLQYFFPGTLVMILLFTSVFCMMSVIEDRNEGFLQSVLISPAPRTSVVLGKVLGGTTIAALQGVVLLPLAPLIGFSLTLERAVLLMAALLLVAFGLTSLGFVFAWRMNSIQGFHAVMNVFLIPMWLLSGALFPPGGAATWVAWVMRINPLTYGLALLHHTLSANPSTFSDGEPGVTTALAITALFGGAMFLLGIVFARRRDR